MNLVIEGEMDMSTAWKYRPSVWEIKSKDIEIKDGNGYVIGGMKRDLPPMMSIAPIFTQAAIGAESHLQYEFWNENNSISIHIDAPLKKIGFVRTIDY